ncbi:hypothetical protein Trydic_g12739, partial [Trypoxylus dichotomus]
MSKLYPDSCSNYNRPPCGQQQNTFTNSNPINTTVSLNHNQLDMVYNSRPVLNRSQYPCAQSGVNMLLENVDGSWYSDQRLNEERVLRQVDNIEISSKDLSPASFCSNFDLLLPDLYKNATKDIYHSKVQDQQLIYNTNYSQRIDYPPCAQMNCEIDGLNKYDAVSRENGGYDCSQPQYYKNGYNMYNQCQDFNATCINSEEYFSQNQFFGSENMPFTQMANIDQQTEGSNEESDIVVEDSEEETDYNELYNSRCIICNCFYVSNGIQFYSLTEMAPLSMSSQKPLSIKIRELLGPIDTKQSYLCGQCLGLVNTIDHLQFKLDNFRKTYSLKGVCSLHIRKHKLMNRFLCDVCGKRFTRKSLFEKHLKLHLDLGVRIRENSSKIDGFHCKVCGIIFRTGTKLKEHQNYCSGRLPYKCKHSSCNKNFATSTKLKYHVKLKHDKKFTSICSICNIGFIKTSDYKSHMVSHSTEKKYQCPQCHKCYKTMSNLNFHAKFHSDRLPFNCEICEKGFMRKEYLESHVNTHKGVKKFSCYICDGKFVSQKNLDSHMKCHDESIRKRSCNLCGKLTANLQDHLRSHNNLKEFNCNGCDMK